MDDLDFVFAWLGKASSSEGLPILIVLRVWVREFF
jgi:hypothetical protein